MKKIWYKRYLIKLKDIIHLNRGADKTDVEGTLSTVRNGISTKGANIWTLAGGCLLACIGLDTNSTVLLISGMLISPLMVPILGIGIFYHTRNVENLKRSIEKVGIVVGISITISLFYFLITPFGEMTPEISSRIKPTLIDALIAFIGGVTGIISISRKNQTTVLPGVAVAITLMPPLCVVGYGISVWNWAIVMGAAYLFLINIVIICFVSSFIVRWLDFPVTYRSTRKNSKRYARIKLAALIVVLLPSTYWFAEMVLIKEKENKVKEFVTTRIGPIAQVIEWRIAEIDTLNRVEVFTSGHIISEDTLQWLQQSFDSLQLNKTELAILQPNIKDLVDNVNQVVDSVKKSNKFSIESEDEMLKEIEIIFDDVEHIKKLNSNGNKKVYGVEWKLLVFNKKKKLEKIDKFIELRTRQPAEVLQM